MTIPRANTEWQKPVKRFWYDSLNDFEFGADGLEVLRMACNCLNRFLEAKEAIDTEGVTFKTESGQIKKHPAAEVEKTARQGFLQAVKMLGFEVDEKRPVGRPGVTGI